MDFWPPCYRGTSVGLIGPPHPLGRCVWGLSPCASLEGTLINSELITDLHAGLPDKGQAAQLHINSRDAKVIFDLSMSQILHGTHLQ